MVDKNCVDCQLGVAESLLEVADVCWKRDRLLHLMMSIFEHNADPGHDIVLFVAEATESFI